MNHLKEQPGVLVTGSTGFLGSRLVKALVEHGYRVRALARKTSRTERLQKLDVEICYGDVADAISLEPAFTGIDFVIHAAADTSGNARDSWLGTMVGTRNVLALCRQFNIEKLVYISSCSVYDIAGRRKGEQIDEESPLERHPQKRGIYSLAKVEAEKIVLSAMEQDEVRAVCLRPGVFFGIGGPLFTPAIGFTLGKKLFIIIKKGDTRLPLVFIDDLVWAILACLKNNDSTGRVYNIVNPDGITKKEYVENVLRPCHPYAHFAYIPYWPLYLGVFFYEAATRFFKLKPVLTRYRLSSSQKYVQYSASRIQKDYGWSPTPMSRAIAQVLDYEMKQSAANR